MSSVGISASDYSCIITTSIPMAITTLERVATVITIVIRVIHFGNQASSPSGALGTVC